MKYCTKCVMPDTRPGITFDENGVCSGCRSHESKKNVDWDKRFKELEALCDKYRGMNGNGYDCMIAVSGGKDSHFQVHLMKEVMKMNPILVSVEDNFPMTDAGIHNIHNISEEFGCNIISLKPDIKAQKTLMRYTFEKYGKPTWFIDRLIYSYPLQMAVKFNTPLLVYGENVSHEYGGVDSEETYSARDQINNGVANEMDFEELCKLPGIDEKVLAITEAPSMEDLAKLDPMYVSYFIPWNSVANYNFAKKRGFHDLEGEWTRTQTVEQFDQIDSRAYLIHPWLKYPKFGHSSATDYASRFVRYGLITRDEAIALANEHDGNIDPKCVKDFCDFLGYKESEFWEIVDKLYNKEIFVKNDLNKWVLKTPIN